MNDISETVTTQFDPMSRRFVARGDIQSPSQLRLYDHWDSKRGDRPRPNWSSIDLMALRSIAPFMIVKDLVDDGADFRYRFFGTGLAQTLGYDPTGRTLREFHTDNVVDTAMPVAAMTMRELRPIQSSGAVYFGEGKEFMRFSALYLPVDDDKGQPAHLLNVIDFDTAEC